MKGKNGIVDFSRARVSRKKVSPGRYGGNIAIFFLGLTVVMRVLEGIQLVNGTQKSGVGHESCTRPIHVPQTQKKIQTQKQNQIEGFIMEKMEYGI